MPNDSLEARVRDIIEDRHRPKLLGLLDRGPLGFPLVTEAGRWVENPIPRWSDGFWPGIFWLAWASTGEATFRRAAENLLRRLAPRIDDPRANYDLGFLFHYSFALGYRLTGNKDYRDVALSAANRLCTFFHEPSELITITYPERIERFGQDRVTTKIDVMMNLSLIWWAYEESGKARYLEVAQAHASRSLNCLLRDDGSVWELADFAPDSGELLLCGTKEGVEGPSCWARAQAWAVYGFLQAAHYSGQAVFHEAAAKALAYWQAHLPPGGVPYWDLLAPPPFQDARDTSAAAIVLAALARSPEWGLDLPDRATLVDRTLDGLDAFLSGPNQDGILTGGCAYYRKNEGRHGATVWGDYYLLEALYRLRSASK